MHSAPSQGESRDPVHAGTTYFAEDATQAGSAVQDIPHGGVAGDSGELHGTASHRPVARVVPKANGETDLGRGGM